MKTFCFSSNLWNIFKNLAIKCYHTCLLQYTKGIMGKVSVFIYQILWITINQRNMYWHLSFPLPKSTCYLDMSTYVRKARCLPWTAMGFHLRSCGAATHLLYFPLYINWYESLNDKEGAFFSVKYLLVRCYEQILYWWPIFSIYLCDTSFSFCVNDMLSGLVWAAEVHSWVPDELARL